MHWKSYFMNLLEHIASRSKDPDTKVGAIIVSKDNNILSTGYNSFPKGINDDVEERLVRPEKYLWIEHAERNAIYAAARSGVSLEGSTIYVSLLPCMACARGIIQSGIKIVVVDCVKQKCYTSIQYQDAFSKVLALFTEANVEVISWEK